jgi:hypothetical protein
MLFKKSHEMPTREEALPAAKQDHPYEEHHDD